VSDDKNAIGESEGVEELRASIAQTREKLAADASALGTKLSPQNIKAEVKQAMTNKVKESTEQVREQVRDVAEQVRDKVTDAGGTAASFVRENTVPLALIGVGVGWLLWNRRNESRRAYAPRYDQFGRSEVYDASEFEAPEGRTGSLRREAGRRFQGISHKMHDGMESVRSAASRQAHHAREKLSELELSARDTAAHARDLADRALVEQPLVLGAVALGAGLAVGLAIPATESENQLVGQYRDRFLSSAKERAHDLRGVAERAVETAQESAKEELATAP
jgi:ElaB/YqjD/DUF883 family membrane-anchored ribosome-binding protein